MAVVHNSLTSKNNDTQINNKSLSDYISSDECINACIGMNVFCKECLKDVETKYGEKWSFEFLGKPLNPKYVRFDILNGTYGPIRFCVYVPPFKVE